MKKISEIRKRYIARLVGRCIILISCGLACFMKPDIFEILEGTSFFEKFSPLHLLWGIWMVDMIQQIIPMKNKVALGSQKLFALRFRPVQGTVNKEKLKKYMVSTSKSAGKVFVLWTALIVSIGVLYYQNIINKMILFIITVFFYVCDLICVLIWCPFRLIMKNKCCTTCRIFNWDHLMMFSPLIFAGGFYAMSLVTVSVAAWLIWEGCILIYPERFSEATNAALKCSNCTDKLCIQYCQKIRKA